MTISAFTCLAAVAGLWNFSGVEFATAGGAETLAGKTDEIRQETQIWTTFALNRHLRAFDLRVDVDSGKAILTGTVDDEAERELAEQIARDVDGIREVDNRVVVDAGLVPRTRPAGERSFGERVDDATLTASVKSQLLWNNGTDGIEVFVDTREGQVTLTGSVPDAGTRERVGRIAASTEGVLGVDNRIAVHALVDEGTRAALAQTNDSAAPSDAWISSRVKSTLLLSRGVEGSGIDVSTQRGIVTLRGKVRSEAERQIAVAVARDVRGVRKVNALLDRG